MGESELSENYGQPRVKLGQPCEAVHPTLGVQCMVEKSWCTSGFHVHITAPPYPEEITWRDAPAAPYVAKNTTSAAGDVMGERAASDNEGAVTCPGSPLHATAGRGHVVLVVRRDPPLVVERSVGDGPWVPVFRVSSGRRRLEDWGVRPPGSRIRYRLVFPDGSRSRPVGLRR